MQNQHELDLLSVCLYKYLCDEVVGSENVVRYRRLYYKLHDDLSHDNPGEIISSGSRAEGLDLPGSDIDIMCMLKFDEVYEDKRADHKAVLILDTENALPGFALIKLRDSFSFFFSPTLTANGNIIASIDFMEYRMNKENRDKYLFEIHGPCHTSFGVIDIDILDCLRCHAWPTVAKQWLFRHRSSGWPSQDIISNIVLQGALLVPIGSKTSDSEGNPYEWRFSFSLSEKILVHSFNHTQLLCYALLKIWLKEILNSENKKVNNKLCSYYMKTVLFWILEEDKNLKWIPKNLLHCFGLCIHRLHYWIVFGYFPNYFIPEHNMIDGKLSRDDLAYLSLTLDNMNMHINWKIFLAPSLSNFRNTPIRIQRTLNRFIELDLAVLPIETFGNKFLHGQNQLREGGLTTRIIYRMMHKRIPNSARNMLAVMFLKENGNALASLTIMSRRNKCFYHCYKECLSRILINTFHDAVFGWLLLAEFFYSTHEYDKMPCILSLSLDMLCLQKLLINDYQDISLFRDISKLQKYPCSCSFIKRMRYKVSKVFQTHSNGLSTGDYPFLHADIPRVGIIGGTSLLGLFYFLNFLYSNKHGNLIETDFWLQCLEQSSEEEIDKQASNNWSIFSCMYLCKASELSTCSISIRHIIKKASVVNRCLKAFYNSNMFDLSMRMAERNINDDAFIRCLVHVSLFALNCDA